MSIADDATRFGRQLRALRRRKRLRQSDVATAADVAQTTISAVERGHGATLSLGMLQRIAGVVGGRVRLAMTWRGGDLDRLTDERHARIASEVARLLRSMGWVVQAEVTFSIGREHGSVDLLAWHAATRTLLVVEIKTVIASSEELLRRLDTKTRLGPVIARRFGWRPVTTGRLVVLPATRTNRRHVLALATLVGPDLEVRGWTVRRWLRAPHDSLSAVWLLTTSDGDAAGRGLGGFERVSRPRKPVADADPRSAAAGSGSATTATSRRAGRKAVNSAPTDG